MTKFRCTSTHAEDLADGRVVGVGEEVDDVDMTEPHNQRLLNEGKLVEVPESNEPTPSDAAQRKADELDVDITTVEGTGQDGRVKVEDVEAAAAAEEGEDE